MENNNVKKDYCNNWLVDSNYIQNHSEGFPDTYYLESLCYNIGAFLKNTPVPVAAKLDDDFKENHRIVFSLGKISKSFEASVNYSYEDFILLVKKWLYQFYPSYTVEEEVEVSLSHEEMLEVIKNNKNVDMNDVLEMKKKEFVKEHLVVEKIMLKEDTFVVNKNGQRSIRISGTIKNPMSLSAFKKELYHIKDDKQKKKFIEENSTFVRSLDKKIDVTIDYQGQQMRNFFKVNADELIECEAKNISPFVWKFGRFTVKFSSQSLMDDCLRDLRKRKGE